MSARNSVMHLREIPISLPSSDLSPWYRFGILDARPPHRAEHTARLRVLRDYCIHMQLEGISWVWCEPLQGSLDVYPGDLLFLPPGFVHGWTYVRETHIAIHFDLQKNPLLTPHNYDYSFNMIESIGREVAISPVNTMPVFLLTATADSAASPLRIPLISHLASAENWRERLEQLVYLWQIRQADTPAARFQFYETLGWMFAQLAVVNNSGSRSDDNGNEGIDALLRAMQNPEQLAALSACTITELARIAGMGVTAFRRAFRAATNRNPHQYIRERQVEQAAYMLTQTSQMVHEIARQVGFDDQFHFSRVFRRIHGRSPRQYRTHSEP